jgi:signal transduction histidine kinase
MRAFARQHSCRPSLLLVMVLWQFALPGQGQAQNGHTRVLVLHSTRGDAQISIVGESELPRILSAGLSGNLDYYSEFIDSARFFDPAHTLAFREFLEAKYHKMRFDLVIAMQQPAIEFVEDSRSVLFPDTPVVFLANTPPIRILPDSTGLVHERNFAATLAFIRQLQPDVRHVFVITGAAAADVEYADAFRRQWQPSDAGPEITYLSGLATDELERRLALLPDDSAVYYLLVNEDGAGHRLHPLDYVTRVAAAANAPTYSWVDSTVGHGVVGGSMYSQRAAIEAVSQIALRVLRGEPADSIPTSTLDLDAAVVDWRELRRWRIAEARVPAGTVVMFRDPSLWERYRLYVLGTVALLLTQTILISGLLIQRDRRRRAQEALRRSEHELRRSYERNRDLGARLLRAQEDERLRIARELHDDICQRMLLLTITLESFGRDADTEVVAEAVRGAQDVARSLHDLSHRLHPTRLRLIGLVAALERLCNEVSRAGMVVGFTDDHVPPALPPDLMLCLFRVAQEGLQNAIKYSHATDVSVRLQGNAHGLTLTIVDNGVGFDVHAAWARGLGLISMQERLEAIGGSLTLHSRPGAGTCLTAVVSLQPTPSLPSAPPLA